MLSNKYEFKKFLITVIIINKNKKIYINIYMNSFLSKSSNLTTDKLYEQKYLKYKSKYLKYIEDNNKIQKGGARYKVLVKKLGLGQANKTLLEIVLWDEQAPPELKNTLLLPEKDCICFERCYMENSETGISLGVHNYPAINEFHKKTPEIKLIIETYYGNNKLSKQTIIRKAFIKAKEHFTKNVEDKLVKFDLD